MYYDLVIIGATAAALGIAESIGDGLKILIVNKTEMVVYEFVNNFKLPGVYSEGAMYYKRFKEINADIMLNTVVTEVKEENNNYLIEIYNTAGFTKIDTRIIVDTTTDRDIKPVKRSLNCLISNKNKECLPTIELEGITFLDDSDETYNTVIMKYDCNDGMSLYEARHNLIDFWSKRPDVLYNWKMVSMGFCFEEKVEVELCKKSENYILMPSAYYDNPADSFNAGFVLGRRLIS